MESSLSLASESFSYSWLSSSSSSPSSSSSSTTTPLESNCQNFNFDDISLSSNSSCVLTYADELFSGGIIKPLFILHPNNDNPTTSSSSSNSRDLVSPISSDVEIHHHHHDGLFTKWKASTRRTLKGISRCIGQLSRKVGCSSAKSVRVIDDTDNINNKKEKKKERQVKRSSITVHPIIGSYAHHESLIHEAVLHCKRSLGATSQPYLREGTGTGQVTTAAWEERHLREVIELIRAASGIHQRSSPHHRRACPSTEDRLRRLMVAAPCRQPPSVSGDLLNLRPLTRTESEKASSS
ncbi:hypothetical protein PIB30_033821 [Stylosanthes scabra]|uniref:Membrane-associated kinase regulator 6 n=1 Tax=Stylosanthes scabra TaxID=79078 RepID=A0ABU6Y9W3_9FABA|nr:hypothetical protein [Stylosanthes scabra]